MKLSRSSTARTRSTVRPMRALLFAEEDETVVQFLTAGDAALPPLIEVAVKVGNEEIIRVVKPPDMDELWTWYVQTGNMEADPSWGKLWETSKALAANIVDGTNALVSVNGKRVAELGCGLGLVGLAAAKSGAASVIFCDREPVAIHCALSSAAVSGLIVVAVQDLADAEAGACSGSLLDWADPQALGQGIDLIVAADCLYDPATAALLAGCCAGLVQGKGTVVIAEPEKERAIGCRAAFLNAAKAAGATKTEILPLPASSIGHPPSVLVVASWE